MCILGAFSEKLTWNLLFHLNFCLSRKSGKSVNSSPARDLLLGANENSSYRNATYCNLRTLWPHQLQHDRIGEVHFTDISLPYILDSLTSVLCNPTSPLGLQFTQVRSGSRMKCIWKRILLSKSTIFYVNCSQIFAPVRANIRPSWSKYLLWFAPSPFSEQVPRSKFWVLQSAKFAPTLPLDSLDYIIL